MCISSNVNIYYVVVFSHIVTTPCERLVKCLQETETGCTLWFKIKGAAT